MIDLELTLIGIIGLFIIFLLFRSLARFQLCALCASVATTWLILLALFYGGQAIDPVLVAILMGGSVVGLLYLLEQKLPERYQLFKLPFYLSLLVAAYSLLAKELFPQSILILALLWLLTLAIQAGRNVKTLRRLGAKIIECCKNW